MNASSASRLRLGKAATLVLAGMLALVGVFALAGTSKAAPTTETVTFDNGQLNVGALLKRRTILPGDPNAMEGPEATCDYDDGTWTPAPPACPDPTKTASALVPIFDGYWAGLTTIPNAGTLTGNPINHSPAGAAEMKVEIDGNTAKVDPADFTLPALYVTNPMSKSGAANYWIPMTMEAKSELTGTWDSSDGKLDLTGDFQLRVITGVAPGGPPPTGPFTLKTCQVNLNGATLSTGPNAITPGVPFSQGLDKDGAVAVTWDSVPAGVPEAGGDCSSVDIVAKGKGAIWLSHGVATPPAPPECEEGQLGTWPDCITPEPEPAANITAVKLLPKKKTIKAGKKVALKVKVTNKGDAAGKVVVKLKVNKKKGVKLAKKVTVNVKAGKTATKKVVFKTTRKAKGKYKVTASGAGKKANSTITVKAAKKKRK